MEPIYWGLHVTSWQISTRNLSCGVTFSMLMLHQIWIKVIILGHNDTISRLITIYWMKFEVMLWLEKLLIRTAILVLLTWSVIYRCPIASLFWNGYLSHPLQKQRRNWLLGLAFFIALAIYLGKSVLNWLRFLSRLRLTILAYVNFVHTNIV